MSFDLFERGRGGVIVAFCELLRHIMKKQNETGN